MSTIEWLLLTHDGTVTRLLEALTGQSITVHIIARYVRDNVLYRNVTLNASTRREPLVWAVATVNLEHLDVEYAHALREGDIGIGKLLRETRLETFREFVGFGLVTAEDHRPEFIDSSEETLLERTYKVYHDDTEIMTITEYFPKDEFEQFLA